MTADLNNPYASPTEVTEPPWSLPPDTEFLFNDEFIAAVGTLMLPKVCVLSGQREGLSERTSTLKGVPSWLLITPCVLLGIILPVLRAVLPSLGFSIEGWIDDWVVLAILAFLILITYGLRQQRSLKLTWYIADSELASFKTIVLLPKLLIAVVAALGVMGLMGITSDGVGFIILVLAIVFVIQSLGPPKGPTASGCYQGLVLVKGFKPPFIQELRRMIKVFEEKYQTDSKVQAASIGSEVAPEGRFRRFPSLPRDRVILDEYPADRQD